ncbi:Cupredoxin superfamily protein [Euphorbia peplus]|nr:Cupredoxin superfamily protein [Euphorbia peplus]
MTKATDHIVGESWGWQNPPNSSFYSSWASSHTFLVGDSLLFNFVTGVHDVATVTADAYNNCNKANLLNIQNNGPANVTLNSTGTFYYFCTFSNHCSIDQKLAVTVVGSASTPPVTTAPPPPTNSSASSVVVSSFMFLCVTMGFITM